VVKTLTKSDRDPPKKPPTVGLAMDDNIEHIAKAIMQLGPERAKRLYNLLKDKWKIK
jgi:hypothetical protein